MKLIDQYYLDAAGGLHFLSAQDQANAEMIGLPLPDPSWTVATPAQVSAIQSPILSTAQKWAAYQAQAKAALDDSDTTMLRISEAIALGLNTSEGADVVAFVNYRRALRAIVTQADGSLGELPVRPSYPIGT